MPNRAQRLLGMQSKSGGDVSDWRMVCSIDEIPRPGARAVKSAHGAIAVFRNDADEIFALLDRCPHKGGMLSKGIVSGREVECPLHGWIIGLDDGNAISDVGCVRSFSVKVEGSCVFLLLDE